MKSSPSSRQMVRAWYHKDELGRPVIFAKSGKACRRIDREAQNGL